MLSRHTLMSEYADRPSDNTRKAAAKRAVGMKPWPLRPGLWSLEPHPSPQFVMSHEPRCRFQVQLVRRDMATTLHADCLALHLNVEDDAEET